MRIRKEDAAKFAAQFKDELKKMESEMFRPLIEELKNAGNCPDYPFMPIVDVSGKVATFALYADDTFNGAVVIDRMAHCFNYYDADFKFVCVGDAPMKDGQITCIDEETKTNFLVGSFFVTDLQTNLTYSAPKDVIAAKERGEF